MGGFPPGLVTGPACKGSTGVCCTRRSCCPPHVLKRGWILLETSGRHPFPSKPAEPSPITAFRAPGPFPSLTDHATTEPERQTPVEMGRWAASRQQSRGTAPRACPLEKSAGPAFPPHLVRVFWCQESPPFGETDRGCSEGLLGPDAACRRPGDACATPPHCPALWEIR